MSDLRTAAQQALEALEALQGGCTDSNDGTVEAITVWCPEIIDALRAALAEPEYPLGRATTDVGVPVYVVKKAEPVQEPVQEPVAVVAMDVSKVHMSYGAQYLGQKPDMKTVMMFKDLDIGTPLYTAPPQRPAEPVQEPVAWTYEWKHRLYGGSLNVSRARWPESHLWIETPLYPAPPQRKPLSEEELDALAIDEDGLPNSHIEFARAVERAHGIV